MAAQLRPTFPEAAKAATPRAPTTAAAAKATTAPAPARRGHLTADEAARRLDLSPARVQEMARAGEIGRKVARIRAERDRHALRLSPHVQTTAHDTPPAVRPVC